MESYLDLTSAELSRLCGLDKVPKPLKNVVWEPVTLKFLGAEHYVLGTKSAEICLTGKNGGFGLIFRNAPLKVPSELFLGPRIRAGLLTDIKICFTRPDAAMPELSMAGLVPGLYPRVLREGELVVIA